MKMKILFTIVVLLSIYFLLYFGVSSDQNSDCAKQVRIADDFCKSLNESECDYYSNNPIPQEIGIRYENSHCRWTGECGSGFACM